ncbi:1-acyl-sn-glycerol-3-phosphate acyltransferase gamma-like [Dysidea avara]|uniref:1-acyl-sn-glycerol-3-phosphate acyltransferase gamma-like n=1 Tax=Dysidea avara TaxID=196820 RepID=UPI00332AFC7D
MLSLLKIVGKIAWLKRLPLWRPILGYVFISTAVIIGCLQVMALPLWPMSKSFYRRVAASLSHPLLLFCVWVAAEWGNIVIRVFGDKTGLDCAGKEPGLYVLNHPGDADFLCGVMLAYEFNILTTLKAIVKKSLMFVPGLGIIFYANEYMFLDRKWSTDQPKMTAMIKQSQTFPYPISFILFCEGTRFTKDIQAKRLEYARSKGLPELQHHLIPKTKAFSSMVLGMKDAACSPALYDVELAFPRGEPSILSVLEGRPSEVHIHIRRIPMSEIPSSEAELDDYCHTLYQEKDKLLCEYYQKGKFNASEYEREGKLRRKILSHLNALFWGCITMFPPSLLALKLAADASWLLLSLPIGLFLFVTVTFEVTLRQGMKEFKVKKS